MQAGKLRHEIIVQSQTSAANTLGEHIPTWGTEFACYAELSNLSGDELEYAKQLNSEINSKFIIRYDEGATIRADMRISYKSRFYYIKWIDNVDERDMTQVVYCERLETIANG